MLFLPNFSIHWYKPPADLFSVINRCLHVDYFSWYGLSEFKGLKTYKYVLVSLLNLKLYSHAVTMAQFNFS